MIDAELYCLHVLLLRHRGRLPGRSADDDGVRPVLNLIIDDIRERIKIQRLVLLVKWCDNCYRRPPEYRHPPSLL